jgi:MFS transporter, ACS family, glucarate transporter
MSQIAAAAPSNARYKVLGLLVVLAAITYLDRLCISAAAPAIMREFDFSPTEMGYIFSAFTFAYAVFEIPSGYLGDWLGTRKALTRIVLWWSAFTVLTAATFGFWSLFVVRLLFGAGEAGAIPNSAGTVSRWFPASQRGRAMAAVCIGHAIGASATVPLVLKLIEHQGWRWPFVEFGLIGALWCIVWYWWFRDLPEEHPAANKAEVELIRRGQQPQSSSHKLDVPWLRLFSQRNLLFICAMYFAYGYAMYFYINWLPTYLLKARGFSNEYTGYFSALPWLFGAVAFVIGGWATDWIVERTGSRRLARRGLGITGLTLSAASLLVVARTENNVLAALLIAFALFFQFLTTPSCWAVCMDTGRRISGVVAGAMNTTGNLAGTIAGVAFGYIVERFGSWEPAFYVAAGSLLCGALLWLLIDPERPLLEDASLVAGQASVAASD